MASFFFSFLFSNCFKVFFFVFFLGCKFKEVNGDLAALSNIRFQQNSPNIPWNSVRIRPDADWLCSVLDRTSTQISLYQFVCFALFSLICFWGGGAVGGRVIKVNHTQQTTPTATNTKSFLSRFQQQQQQQLQYWNGATTIRKRRPVLIDPSKTNSRSFQSGRKRLPRHLRPPEGGVLTANRALWWPQALHDICCSLWSFSAQLHSIVLIKTLPDWLFTRQKSIFPRYSVGKLIPVSFANLKFVTLPVQLAKIGRKNLHFKNLNCIVSNEFTKIIFAWFFHRRVEIGNFDFWYRGYLSNGEKRNRMN